MKIYTILEDVFSTSNRVSLSSSAVQREGRMTLPLMVQNSRFVTKNTTNSVILA